MAGLAMNGLPGALTAQFEEAREQVGSEAAAALLSPRLAVGDPEALYLRAHIFVGDDSEEGSLRLLQQSASKGYHPAIFQMGMNYLFGDWGVERDEATAAACFAQASAGGYPPAHYEYGLALLHGKGIERDVAKAMKLINAAAEAGNEYALEFLSSKEP